MAKIIPQGTYYLKDNLNFQDLTLNNSLDESIEFKIDSTYFTNFIISSLKGTSQTHFHLIYKNDDSEYDVFVCSIKNTNNYVLSSEWFTYPKIIDNPKVITFESNTSVSDEFYFWFQNNIIPSVDIVEIKIQSIIQKIARVTKKEYTNLTDAVEDLISKAGGSK